MNYNLGLISLELVKIYNIDGFYEVRMNIGNHPVKNSLNFCHSGEANIASSVANIVLFYG